MGERPSLSAVLLRGGGVLTPLMRVLMFLTAGVVVSAECGPQVSQNPTGKVWHKHGSKECRHCMSISLSICPVLQVDSWDQSFWV